MMPRRSLPDASSPALQLAHPTSLQKYQQTLRNSAVWRGVLSKEAYLRREEYLANQTLTINSGITHWVLVDIVEPVESRRVLCSCESICKRALVAQDGVVRDAISHCVSNVFSPPEDRGRGYAARMMKELGNVLKTYQTGRDTLENRFSTLWFDIGKTFYARHGWKAFSSSHICIPPESVTSKTLPSSDSLRIRLLYERGA